MVMHGATYTIGRPSEQPFEITAGSMVVDKVTTRLSEVSFRKGEDISGTCSQATVQDNAALTILSGNVQVQRLSDDVCITADELVWDQDGSILHSDGQVTVQYGDGTILVALGFTAQLEEQTYESGKILEGRLSD